MPFEEVPGTNICYGLISFDAAGQERTDDPAGKMSDNLLERVVENRVTEIFLFCHGWMGDVEAAKCQYNRWIKASANAHEASSAAFKNSPPMYIGLHWPSLPWGDEELSDAFGSGPSLSTSPKELFETYVDRLGDRPQVRDSLRVIFEEARRNAAPERLPTQVKQAYLHLNSALGLSSSGVCAPPDADREPFDPDESFEAANQLGADFGAVVSLGGMLGPLRQLSYWTMKKRGRTVGEHGMHEFLKNLQIATTSSSSRIHLMGHSFGTIVVSGMVGGPDSRGTLSRPVDSMALVQGAVSLWSYAASIPFNKAKEGYFYPILTGKKIRGPLITTTSRWDRAVGLFYPLASRMNGSPSFATGFPEYGAIGSFGIQGAPEGSCSDIKMEDALTRYDFENGRIYNLDASQYICKGSGASGAHSDISGPEVAHAILAAAVTSSKHN